jgi:sigma-E factor negative regulatory protein RseB
MLQVSSAPSLRLFGRLLVTLCALGALGLAGAQPPANGHGGGVGGGASDRSVGEWLLRMHEASRRRSYIGTFVVSSYAGTLSSARIWHACEGDVQMERVESLSGTPRAIFRRNDDVMTFLPESRVARSEKRESLGAFPNLLTGGENSIPDYYAARSLGHDRVAGHDADVVQLAPKDNLRYGYRIWSERKSGLVVKLQTLDTEGNVLEQAAFSELQLDAPVRMDRLAQMMASTDGYRIEKADAMKTTATAEGWTMKSAVAGFKPMSCYKRPAADNTMQWIFSDGLASVSLFVEPYDRQRHTQEGLFAAVGATQTLTHRVQDWWVTAVGEVPPHTLKAFAQSLERRR